MKKPKLGRPPLDPAKGRMKAAVTFYMPPDLKKKLDGESARYKVTLSTVCRVKLNEPLPKSWVDQTRKKK